MIITKTDIDGFEAALEEVVRASRSVDNIYGTYYEGHQGDLVFNRWLAENPQVLMAGASLQEFVAAHTLPLYVEMVRQGLIVAAKRPVFRNYTGQWLVTRYDGYE